MASQVPDAVCALLRLVCEVDALSLTVLEERPLWDAAGEGTRTPVARPRYIARRCERCLCCVTGNGDFRLCDLAPAPSVLSLLEEIERDPTAIFWG